MHTVIIIHRDPLYTAHFLQWLTFAKLQCGTTARTLTSIHATDFIQISLVLLVYIKFHAMLSPCGFMCLLVPSEHRTFSTTRTWGVASYPSLSHSLLPYPYLNLNISNMFCKWKHTIGNFLILAFFLFSIIPEDSSNSLSFLIVE